MDAERLRYAEEHADLGVGHVWTNVACPAYRSYVPSECVCTVPAITRAVPSDAGCWVDGHWGQYGVARLIDIARNHGYADAEVIDLATRHLDSMGPSDAPDLSTDEHEALSWAADEVEAWMNDHVAPEGFYFEWNDGEFFLVLAGEFDDEEDEDTYNVEVDGCRVHAIIGCTSPECDKFGVLHSEMVENEVWEGTE